MPHQTHKYSHTQPHSFAYVNWLTHINTPTSAYRCISMHLIVLKAPHSYDVVYVPGWISLSFLLSIITSILSIWVPEEKKRNVYMCVHACVRACVRKRQRKGEWKWLGIKRLMRRIGLNEIMMKGIYMLRWPRVLCYADTVIWHCERN